MAGFTDAPGAFQLPLLMQPHFSPRPWGGRELERVLGKQFDRADKHPASAGPQPIGEAWELSDHPDGLSRVAIGPFAGVDFGELMRAHPRPMLNVDRAPDRYPLLVKYIDAAEDLSIQVHPDDATAPAGDRGKTECWYIMAAKPGAEIICGLRPGTTREALAAAARQGNAAMQACMHRLPIVPGDFLHIPAGTVHAILGGTLLCEVQQSSNTTYRLWDWDRHPARELHVDAGAAVADCTSPPPLILHSSSLPHGQWHQLVENAYFQVQMMELPSGSAANVFPPNEHGLVLNVVEGAGQLELQGEKIIPLKLGQTWFLPAACAPVVAVSTSRSDGTAGMRILVSRSKEI